MSVKSEGEIELSCATCRFAATHKRPRVVDATGFGDQIEFGDDDETVYSCKADASPHAGKEVGTTPVYCDAHEAVKKRDMSDLDRRIAAMEARHAAAEKGDDRG